MRRGRDLSLLWMKEVEVEVLSFSRNHIDARVGESSGNAWSFTRFYGDRNASYRDQSWDLLRLLNQNNPLHWLCAGDFNEILTNAEKWGGAIRPVRQMKSFRRVIDDCQLLEVLFTGPSFTWSRGSGQNKVPPLEFPVEFYFGMV